MPHCLNKHTLEEIVALEKKSLRTTKQRNSISRATFNDQDYPSLPLDYQNGNKPNRETPQLGLGRPTIPKWNEAEAVKKKHIQSKHGYAQVDEFPALVPQKVETEKKKEVTLEDEFPTYVHKQRRVESKEDTHSMVCFNRVHRPVWD